MKRWIVLGVLTVAGAFAQSGSSALIAVAKYAYTSSKTDVLKSAQEMPEENYSFRPVDTVRSFGQLVGHVADGQYEFCSAVLGDNSKHPDVEKSKTSKADLIAALQQA